MLATWLTRQLSTTVQYVLLKHNAIYEQVPEILALSVNTAMRQSTRGQLFQVSRKIVHPYEIRSLHLDSWTPRWFRLCKQTPTTTTIHVQFYLKDWTVQSLRRIFGQLASLESIEARSRGRSALRLNCTCVGRSQQRTHCSVLASMPGLEVEIASVWVSNGSMSSRDHKITTPSVAEKHKRHLLRNNRFSS